MVYSVGRSFLKFFIVAKDDTVQLLERALCLFQLSLAETNSYGRVDGSFMSYSLDVIRGIQLQNIDS